MPTAINHIRRRARNPNAGITEVRHLTTADLALLRQPAPKSDLKRIRDVHHTIAYYFALDMSNVDIAERLGMSIMRISQLRHTPAVIELTDQFRAHRHAARLEHIDEFERTAIANKRKAERVLEHFVDHALDAVMDTDRPVDLPTARFIDRLSTSRMDRFGYGKTSTNVNVNVDFAKKLEAAISRSRKVIDQ
jgi:hypothetical protein